MWFRYISLKEIGKEDIGSEHADLELTTIIGLIKSQFKERSLMLYMF
jgi:hypothetical protein